MSNSIPTPRQKFTLNFAKSDVIAKLKYVADELPTYKFISHNETLNSVRIEITRGFQPQHLDFRFDELEDLSKCSFEVEVSKNTGGMTDDDSNLYAKKNLEESIDFLVKCLGGYEITEEDKKAASKNQLQNIIIGLIVIIAAIWWIGSGIYW